MSFLCQSASLASILLWSWYTRLWPWIMFPSCCRLTHAISPQCHSYDLFVPSLQCCRVLNVWFGFFMRQRVIREMIKLVSIIAACFNEVCLQRWAIVEQGADLSCVLQLSDPSIHPAVHFLYPYLSGSCGAAYLQRTLCKRWGTPWIGLESITGPYGDKRDERWRFTLSPTCRDNLE